MILDSRNPTMLIKRQGDKLFGPPKICVEHIDMILFHCAHPEIAPCITINIAHSAMPSCSIDSASDSRCMACIHWPNSSHALMAALPRFFRQGFKGLGSTRPQVINRGGKIGFPASVQQGFRSP